jgi:homoserine dehydrogenase
VPALPAAPAFPGSPTHRASLAPTGLPVWSRPLRTWRVGLLGLGTVGQGLVALLERRRQDVERRHGVSFRIEAVLVRDPSKPRRTPPVGIAPTSDAAAFAAGTYDVVVEAIGGLEPAGSLVGAFLARGVPVVTANKALLAERAGEFHALARSRGTALRHEASVAAGVPLFSLLERSLQTTTVARVEAVLNATSHFALARIEAGASLSEALAEARRAGYAEENARLDTSGYDAAQKLSVLVWALSGRCRPWTGIEIEGIEEVTPADAARARVLGGRLLPIAFADLSQPSVVAFVGPTFVPTAHPLASLEGAQNGVRLAGDTIESLFLSGPGAGGTPTAAALLDDLIAVATGAPPGPPPPDPVAANVPLGPPPAAETGWYLALPAAGDRDPADVLRARAAASGVPIETLIEVDESGRRVAIALTRPATRTALRRLSGRLARSDLSLRAFRALPPS